MQTVPTVLIADDDILVRQLLAVEVQAEGCKVVAFASDGKEAIKDYLQHKPDITLLDINMPKMDGVDVLKRIREQDDDSFVFIVSANTSSDVIRDVMALGVSGFLVKPIGPKKVELVFDKYKKFLLSAGKPRINRCAVEIPRKEQKPTGKPDKVLEVAGRPSEPKATEPPEEPKASRKPKKALVPVEEPKQPEEEPVIQILSFYPSEEELAYAKRLIKSARFQEMPAVFSLLQQELMKDDPDLDRVIDGISSDDRLSVDFLKLVASTAPGLKQQIGSVHQAIVLMGQNKLKKLMIAMALKSAFGEEGAFVKSVWRQSHAVAIGAETLSRTVEGVAPEDVFLAGLFQDIGVLICGQMHSGYRESYRQSHPFATSLPDADRETFKTTHVVVSYLLAQQWELSKQAVDAILLSHHADLSCYIEKEKRDFRALVSVLKMTNYLVAMKLHPEI